MMKDDKYIPIGSVVTVEKSIRQFMVVSRGVVLGVGEKITFYDYGMVYFPEGMTEDKLYYANKEDIDEVLFLGLESSEDKEVSTKLENWKLENSKIL